MIEVTKYKEMGKGPLAGIFSIKLHKWGNFYINKMCYFKDGNKRWVTFPSETYEVDGKKKYAPYNGFEESKTSIAFQEKVLVALDEYLKKQR